MGRLELYKPYHGMTMRASNVTQSAHQLIDNLPENATWDDVVYKIVMRREIKKGLADSDANRTTPAEDVLKEFGFDACMKVHWTGRPRSHSRSHCQRVTSPHATNCRAIGSEVDPNRRGAILRSRSSRIQTCHDVREILERPYRILYRVHT